MIKFISFCAIVFLSPFLFAKTVSAYFEECTKYVGECRSNPRFARMMGSQNYMNILSCSYIKANQDGANGAKCVDAYKTKSPCVPYDPGCLDKPGMFGAGGGVNLVPFNNCIIPLAEAAGANGEKCLAFLNSYRWH